MKALLLVVREFQLENLLKAKVEHLKKIVVFCAWLLRFFSLQGPKVVSFGELSTAFISS